MTKRLVSTQMMIRVALLAAISFILFKFMEIPIVAFYQLDLSGIPLLLAGFAMGPLAGMLTLAVKDILAIIGTKTGMIGEVADFLMLACLVLPSAVLYQRKRELSSVLMGMAAGTVLMIIAGMLLNYYVLIPLYGVSEEVLINMANAGVPFLGVDSAWKFVLLITGPFNLLKGGVLSVVTYLIYPYLSPILKKGRI